MSFRAGDKVKIICAKSVEKANYLGQIRVIAEYNMEKDAYRIKGVNNLIINNLGYPSERNVWFTNDELELASMDDIVNQLDAKTHKRLNELNDEVDRLKYRVNYLVDTPNMEDELKKEKLILQILLAASVLVLFIILGFIIIF